MTVLAGWGNYPAFPTELLEPSAPAAASKLVAERSGLIARGNGRAYGDAAIGQHFTVMSTGLNRMRSFDPHTGLLTVESGVLLADILDAFVPRGYFPKVVPGTKLVTVGGAIAADVHGKNHHRDGGFGDNLESLRLVLPNGDTVVCSRSQNVELFAATIGGMGLTGVILEATIPLRRIETGWLLQQTKVAKDLDSAIAGLESSERATYSVAWIDCLARGASLGRSLIYSAEHATRDEKAALRPDLVPFPAAHHIGPTVPPIFPSWALNRASVRAFNELYFRRGASRAGIPSLVDWNSYFFPLDAIAQWNRIYGPKGFVQYQCVIPVAQARIVLAEIMDRVSRRGSASFLAVLKLLGGSNGAISFPLRGYTLAMDFPMTETLLPFLDGLDELVVKAGGRIYLAKDARQSRATFEAGYPGLPGFRDIRRHSSGNERLVSRLSTRLGI
jgi:decaprenylphospho-beta-D-ribofuranose 2-oxidase